MKNPFSRGKLQKSCRQNPETGEINCRVTREMSDGMKEELAGRDFQHDGQCNPIITSEFENEEGALKKLNVNVESLRKQCERNLRNVPQEY